MQTKAYRQQTWTILLLFVGNCFCAVSITQSNTNTDKGSNLNLFATTEEAGVTWTFKGGVQLTTCLISQQLCLPTNLDNMKFTADNSTNTSTIAFQSLNCSLNSETYVASTSLATASVTILVTTPISSISSTTNLTSAKVSSQELSVEVDCVNLKISIPANYSVFRSGKPDDILIPDSIQPITLDSACNCIEKTHVITKIITALQYPNEVVEVQANVGQLALSIGIVNFTAGVHTSTLSPTTKQPKMPGKKCCLRVFDVSKWWCDFIIICGVVVIVAIIVGVSLLIWYICCRRNKKKENGQELKLKNQHTNDPKNSNTPRKYTASEESHDDKLSEENTREGHENKSRSIQDDKESNSFTNESSVDKSRESNEILQDESGRNTDM